jgi:hypothetical protein
VKRRQIGSGLIVSLTILPFSGTHAVSKISILASRSLTATRLEPSTTLRVGETSLFTTRQETGQQSSKPLWYGSSTGKPGEPAGEEFNAYRVNLMPSVFISNAFQESA